MAWIVILLVAATLAVLGMVVAVLLVIGAGRADREIEEALRMQQWNARKAAPKEMGGGTLYRKGKTNE